MTQPDKDCLPEVRENIEQALRRLRDARDVLRDSGFSYFAEMLGAPIACLAFWLQPGVGWQHQLEKPGVDDDDVQS